MHDQVSEALPALLQPGQVLVGKYQVERVLGAGAMGFVIAARHLDLDQPVAIKLMRPDVARSADSVTRFIREARAAARIPSEHVVRIHDVGRLEGGAPYIVMEHLAGTDLDGLLRARGPLPIEEVAEYVLQACEALAEAHMRGVVHRDLKPSNLFLCRRTDGSPLVKVLDFGISKVRSDGRTHEASLTATAEVFGTPYYMSPEQVQSAKDVDHRTDIWALGVMLHRLLAAAYPFDAESMPNCLVKIITEAPVTLRAHRPGAPASLEAVILACLEKSLSKRIPDVAVLARRLLPFAPAHCQALVDRIVRIVRGSEGIEDEITTMPGALEAKAPGSAEPEGGDKTQPAQQPIWTPPGADASSPALSSSQPLQQLAVSAPGAVQPRNRSAAYATVAVVLTGCVALLGAAGVRSWLASRPRAEAPDAAVMAASPSVLPSPQETSAPPAPAAEVQHAVAGAPAQGQAAATGAALPEVAAAVQIRVRVDPPDAQIELDGHAAESPLRLPRSSQVHRVRIWAPGYLPVTREIVAEADAELDVTLDAQAAAGSASRSAGKRAGSSAAGQSAPAAARASKSPGPAAPAPASPTPAAPAASPPPTPPVNGPLEVDL